MVTLKGISTIVSTLFGGDHTSTVDSRVVDRVQSDLLPAIFYQPILSRGLPEHEGDIDFVDIVQSLVIESRVVSQYADPRVASVLLKSMATVRHSLQESFYSVAVLSGAVHFAEIGVNCSDINQTQTLNELSIDLADEILTSAHLTASKIFNKMLDRYIGSFRQIFGSHDDGIIAFRSVVVVTQLEVVPLLHRKRILTLFVEFLQQSTLAIKEGSFAGASLIFELRDTLLRPVLLDVRSFLTIPSTCKADSRDTKRMRRSL